MKWFYRERMNKTKLLLLLSTFNSIKICASHLEFTILLKSLMFILLHIKPKIDIIIVYFYAENMDRRRKGKQVRRNGPKMAIFRQNSKYIKLIVLLCLYL